MALKEDQIVKFMFENRIRLISFIRSIVCDFHVSEDLYQKTCILALQSCETFVDSSHLQKWIWIVCRNESLKYLREQKKSPILFDEQILEMIQSESEKVSLMDDPEIFSILEKCLSQLSEPVKKLLEKRYKYDLTGVKLAESLNMNVKSIYVAVSRAHRSLYNCMHKRIKFLRD